MADQSPYVVDSFQNPPPKQSNNKLWWILGTIGLLGSIAVVVCCGGFGLLGYWGLQIAAAQIEEQIRGEPEIEEHIGVIESFSMDLTRSAANNEQDVMVYTIKGSKGAGTVIVGQIDGDRVQSAKLRMTDGKEIDVLP